MTMLTKKNPAKKSVKASQRTSLSSKRTTLVPGPQWSSFEKFRVQGSSALAQIAPGTVGTLTSQGQQFRLLCESDFQHLVGLARDADCVRQGLRVVHAAVRTVQEHPGQSSVNTLMEAALLLGDSPLLPMHSQFAALEPEQRKEITADGDDEVEIDPKAVRRPLGDRA